MSLGQNALLVYRPLVLTSRQATLLGMIWIAVQRIRGQGAGSGVEFQLLKDLVFAAQNRGLISPAVDFQFERADLPELKSRWLDAALEELKRQGFIYFSGSGSVGFPGVTGADLPTGIFRWINFFAFADLVAEFTGGRDGE